MSVNPIPARRQGGRQSPGRVSKNSEERLPRNFESDYFDNRFNNNNKEEPNDFEIREENVERVGQISHEPIPKKKEDVVLPLWFEDVVPLLLMVGVNFVLLVIMYIPKTPDGRVIMYIPTTPDGRPNLTKGVAWSDNLFEKMKLSLLFTLGWFILLVLFDWVGKISGYEKLRSTYWIDYYYEKCISFFRLVGRWIARISSFYIYFHLGDLFESIVQVLTSLFKVAFSWTYVFKGYADALHNLYINRSRLVIFGSITILVAIGAGVFYFCYHHH